ncbi:MAG: putative metal-binding motif-containing protein [Sandaracinaceae bacterium]|nr:putative metal-binding motif-containing protein [Sandaracinaceae bacterium]
MSDFVTLFCASSNERRELRGICSLALGSALFHFALLGCGDPSPSQPDAFIVLVDAAPECEKDQDCDDRIGCTLERCIGGRCTVFPRDSECDDGVFCNGFERCDPERGCAPPEKRACDDGSPCTLDRCIEEQKRCEHMPRDIDEDGDPDGFCVGGSDCDDNNPLRSGRQPEICGDRIDNNCNGRIDETPCSRSMHDRCEDALRIDAPGTYLLSFGGSSQDHLFECVGSRVRDLFVVFTIPGEGPKDVSILARAERAATYLALLNTCTSPERECRSGYPARLRLRSLPPGEYVLAIGVAGVDDEVVLELDWGDATPAPPNETCTSAAVISVPMGGSYRGSFVGVQDDHAPPCGRASQGDLVYTFDIPPGESYNLFVTLSSPTSDPLRFSVLRGCDGELLRCAHGTPARGRVHRIGEGRYYLILEGPNEADYVLNVAFEPPSDPVSGDRCSSPISLEPATPYMGTLLGAEDDIEVSCAGSSAEIIHRFELTEPSDIELFAESSAPIGLALLRECPPSSASSEIMCRVANAPRIRAFSLPPGVYFPVVEGWRGGAYRLEFRRSAPRPIIEAMGNDDCSRAHPVGDRGGLFSGSTSSLSHNHNPTGCAVRSNAPDAVFAINLSRRSRVIASTHGSSFDTVLYVLDSLCTTELACNDDTASGTASEIDTVLNPGRYHLVVDGFAASDAGSYLLEVQIETMP